MDNIKSFGNYITEDWGSSDQSIMNQSIHKEIGKPKEMPSPFDKKLRDAVENNVDFYWDDWPEYKRNRDKLIDHAVLLYLRAYWPEKVAKFQKMFS